MPDCTAPVGVFDSGVGGLSVLREIRRRLPHESLLYLADSAHVPYGEKSPEYIRERCRTIAAFFVEQGAKALVVACNTATAAGVTELRELYPDWPIIGMEPAVKPAAAATRSGVVGVLATTGTLKAPDSPHCSIVSPATCALSLSLARGWSNASRPVIWIAWRCA